MLARMQGDKAVMASLLYGSGLRLMEHLRLRVKDVDFGQNHIVVRDGKGQFDVSASLLDNSMSVHHYWGQFDVSASLLLPLHQVGKLQRQFGVSRDNSVSERQFSVRRQFGVSASLQETIRCQWRQFGVSASLLLPLETIRCQCIIIASLASSR